MNPDTSGSRFLRYQLPVLGWALLIFIASSIPSLAPIKVKSLQVDKILHCAVFFVLAWLLYRAILNQARRTLLRRNPKLFTLVLGVAYGVFDEVHQFFVTGRSSEIYDVIADAAGVVAFVLIAWAGERSRARGRTRAD
jgi:VanZ family protein